VNELHEHTHIMPVHVRTCGGSIIQFLNVHCVLFQLF